ncbi:uncharacterized protein BO72DRAFT_97766 [Aspergillus fijiensis CBS 313.89]|uniref:Uncharacterized protein n=1 Tax=Aspergillus fijiensis CBS 313.89 TaxID=1448319 RepID=A0A8G1RS29_9EURO|nr:uncharacterized protein BO72DRAFT_97766 [Aspergillus fijiensis CBS 313.89]RAK77864.1 hypothetical protein BO72DRAFT_97766 [Aspergillus fijiensis CBS 313.89]
MSWERITMQLPTVLSCLPNLEKLRGGITAETEESACVFRWVEGAPRERATSKKQVAQLLRGLRRLSLQTPYVRVPDAGTKTQSLAADFLACLLDLPETSPTQSAPETENEMEQDVPPDSSTLVLELLALAEMAVPVSVPATFATLATQSLRHFDMHRVLLDSGNWCDVLSLLSHMPQLVKFRLKRCKQWGTGSDRELICLNLVPKPRVEAEVDECDYKAPLACLPLELGLAYVAALRQVNTSRSIAGMCPL